MSVYEILQNRRSIRHLSAFSSASMARLILIGLFDGWQLYDLCGGTTLKCRYVPRIIRMQFCCNVLTYDSEKTRI